MSGPSSSAPPIRFDDGAAYERYMGVWSRLAGATYNREMSGILGTMADEFQRSAEELDKKRG